MELTRRDLLAAGAATAAAAGIASVAGMPSAQVAQAEEAASSIDHSAEEYNYTFNNGPLTCSEQHATISEYDWTSGKLSVSEIAEAAKLVSDDEARAILFNEPQITQDFVKSDGTVIPAIYVQLRNRINRIGLGIGAEIDENAFDFFTHEVTEEEAKFYCAVPMFRFFNDEEAAEAAGITVEKARELLDALSYRGWLNRVTRCGINFYHTLAFAHGILEFTLNRYCAGAEGKEDYVKDIFSIRGADYGYTSRNLGSAMYFTVPVQRDVMADAATQVLPFCDWENIIDRNEVIAVMPCQCRTFTPILAGGEPGDWCDHPVETCISVGEQAQYYIENNLGRQIDKDEAKQIIQRSVDAGMVIQVMNTKQCDVICSCHGDCCGILRGYIGMEGDVENLKYVSNYKLEVDTDACLKCGACAERCPLFTITMDEETGLPTVGNLCVRCGQCATVCPAGARKLVPLPKEERLTTMGNDMIDDYYIKSLERAKRGFIVDFDPAKVQ